MNPLALSWSLAVPLLLGILLLRLLGLRHRDDRIGFPAWSWLLGCLALAALLRLCREIGLPVGVWWAAPLPALGLLLLVPRLLGARRRAAAASASAVPPTPAWFHAFVAVGVLFCLWFALVGFDRPCLEGDEGNIWSLKAKSLLVDWDGSYGGPGFAAAQVWNLHPDYPQLNPWLQAWVYALTGVPDFEQFANRWPIQLCDVALFVATAAALRRLVAPILAAMLAALVLLEPEFRDLCRTAYADGMVAFGVVVALDAFLRWRSGGPRAFAWLAALGFAFALASKNEATLYLASLALALPIARWLLRREPLCGGLVGRNLALLLPPILVAVNTTMWNRRFGMKSDLFGANPTGKSMFALMAEQWRERVPLLAGEAARAVAALEHSHAVFGLLLFAAIVVPRRAFGRELALPLLALFGSLAGLHLVYVGSFLPLRFHLDTSYLRVLFQLLPAAVVLLGACLAAGWPRRQDPEPA
ncbi:MAG: hypothetical protein KDE27_25975 [Planctomycetes bacterium]|nr:hypothetical protein [Planctomycetota bacterium]